MLQCFESLLVLQTLRGKMWHTFLGLEAVKKEGYYEQLVFQALGNKYSKRKVCMSTYISVCTVAHDMQNGYEHSMCIQEKSGQDEQAGSPNAAPGDISVADTVGSPAAAQVAEQAEVVRLAADVEAFEETSEAQEVPASPAAASPAAASPEPQQAPEASGHSLKPGQSDAGLTQVGSQLLSLSSESLSALPTLLHPAAVPPAVAQDLNNALARSLLQGPSGMKDNGPGSARLTSAYSG